MPAVINTNLASLFAQNSLSGAQKSLSTSVQRLSSGLRINSAADDAAGLSVAQNMQSAINAINMGVRNVGDAANLLMVNSAGNLGLGVTPSAWYNSNNYVALQVGNASLFGRNSVNSELYLSSNIFDNSSGTPTYITTDFASRYVQNDGVHSWLTAPSGTAGNAITFTQAMTLTAAGYLSVSGNVATNNPPSYQGLSFGWNKSNGYGESLITYTNIGGGSMPRLDFGYWNGTTYSIQTTIFNSGNVLIGSSVTDSGYKLDVNGTGRFSGNVTLSNTSSLTLGNGSSERIISASSYIEIYNVSTGDMTLFSGYSTASIKFCTANSSTPKLTIASTGAATFSSSVTATSFNRSTAGTGFLNGKYAGAETTATTGPIYCIGDSYTPTSTSLNTMYGIGYSYNNFTGKYGPADTWGMYVAGGGTANVFLTADGRGFFSSTITASGFFESSDSRLKTLIQDNYQTKGIASITPKLYTKNGKVELGYYAQDFVGVLDSAVSKGSDDMLSLSYREVHTAKIYALEQEIKELKAKMN